MAASEALEGEDSVYWSTCNTVELIKLFSARFAEFLDWILDFQIGAPVDVLLGHSWAPVRLNDLQDRASRRLNDFVGSVQPDPVFQAVNGHQDARPHRLLLQRIGHEAGCFVNELRIESLPLSKLPAQKVAPVLSALVGIGRNKGRKCSHERPHNGRKGTDPCGIHCGTRVSYPPVSNQD